MPEKITDKRKTTPAAPLVQVNLGVGIGSVNRARDEVNEGSGRSWEEGNNWKAAVKSSVVNNGYEGPVLSPRGSKRLPGIPIGCLEMGVVDAVDRVMVAFQFTGISLAGVRFMRSGSYYRPADSDSAVYARLSGSRVLVLSKQDDVLVWEIQPAGLPFNEYYVPELASCDPQKMGISVVKGANLVVVRYNKRS